MVKSVAAFNLAYFLVIGVVSWILKFFPTCTVCSVYDSAARTLLTCIIAYFTLPLVKKRYFSQRVSSLNKAVVITGCDTGFGHLLAKKLDSKGFHVFASCLFPDGDGAKNLKDTCSDSLHVFGLNVTKDADVKAAVDYVKANLGSSELWAVVNNAGMVKGFATEWTRIEDFKEVMDTNAMGIVRVTKAFLPLLRKTKGRVVTVTSLAARIPAFFLSPYCMSKFAASCFCECLRQEMHPWGVKVITIEPENFRTPIADPETLISKFDDDVKHLDNDIKEDYGLYYFDGCKVAMKRYLKTYSPKLYKVIDNLEDAVTLEEPSDVYKPCQNIFNQLLRTILEPLPRPTRDILIRAASYMFGLPQPKEAEHRF